MKRPKCILVLAALLLAPAATHAVILRPGDIVATDSANDFGDPDGTPNGDPLNGQRFL